MRDALLMRVLDCLANRNEQCQTLFKTQFVGITILSDWNAIDQFHDKERLSASCGPGIENSGYVLMVHHGQRLPLGLKTGNDLATIEALLDDLQRDAPTNRSLLFSHPDLAHATFTDPLEQFVRADKQCRLRF